MLTPRTRALRRMLRCLRRATADLCTIELELRERPADYLRLQPLTEKVRRELYALAEDLGRKGRVNR